jgi:hypothetical protein
MHRDANARIKLTNGSDWAAYQALRRFVRKYLRGAGFPANETDVDIFMWHALPPLIKAARRVFFRDVATRKYKFLVDTMND